MYIKFKRIVYAIACILLVWAPFSANGLLTFFAAIALSLLARFTLTSYSHAAIFLALLIQWVQVAAELIRGNMDSVAISTQYFQGEKEFAITLGFTVIVLAALTVRILLLKNESYSLAEFRSSDYPMRELGFAYIIFSVLSIGVQYLVAVGGQMSQVAEVIFDVRLVLFVLIWMVALRAHKYYALGFFVLVYEVLSGLFGFFAGFVVPLLLLILAFVHSFDFTSRMQRIAFFGVGAVLVVASSIWGIVKPEYRMQVSGYTGEQIVVMPLLERAELLVTLTEKNLGMGWARSLDVLADRLGYIDYFSQVVALVPSQYPHENGGRWKAVADHILMPRVLFPEKPPLPSDSELTAYYTNNPFMAYSVGTSISLGYATEGYIDFGVIGSLLTGIMLGALLSGIWWLSLKIIPNAFLAAAVATPLLLEFRLFETSLVKMVGGGLSSAILLLALFWLAKKKFLFMSLETKAV